MRRTVLDVVYLVSLSCGPGRGNVLAQNSSQPIRVAIVGLEHGHVAGFLKQFPKQHEVQLVGIVDADTGSPTATQSSFISTPAFFMRSWMR